MTEKAVQERLIRLLETDWKGHAAILLEERLDAVALGQDASYVSPSLSTSFFPSNDDDKTFEL